MVIKMDMLFRPLLLSLLLIGMAGCAEQNGEGKTTPEDSEVPTQPDTLSQNIEADETPMMAYVAAKSGLNLRAGTELSDEVLVKIPCGAKVERYGDPEGEIPFAVENIHGLMVKVNYEGQTGYAFSTFLSPFPVPAGPVEDKYQYVRDYIAQLKAVGHEADLQETDLEEARMTVTLPEANIETGFLVMKLLFSIPNAYTLPPQGQSIDHSTPEAPSKAAQEGPYDYVTHTLSYGENNGSGSSIKYYDDAETGGRELVLSETRGDGGPLKITLRTWTH